MLETARHLTRHGVAVEVLTRRLDRAAPAFEDADGIPVHRIGTGPASLPVELVRVFREVRAFAAHELARFDLVHAHLTLTALPLLAPLRALGRPLVATFYGPWDREYRAELEDPGVPSRWPRPLRPLVRVPTAALLRRLQGRVLARADRVVVLSRHSELEMERFGYTVRAPVRLVRAWLSEQRQQQVLET